MSAGTLFWKLEVPMKRLAAIAGLILIASTLSFGATLGTSARTVIPYDIQQIISVDYRALHDSPTAMALKNRVLPDNLKQFETALHNFGLNTDGDVDQLVFASFRTNKGQVKIIGVAEGQFPLKKLMLRMKTKKISPVKYRQSSVYPMDGGIDMVFLDGYTMVFGDKSALDYALDVRDGQAQGLNLNENVLDLLQSVQEGAVWSVLDQQGTQNMMRSTLGDAARLADYDTVKKRLVGSRYIMDFNQGVSFNLDVVTSDSMTASTLSSLIKAGLMFRKMNADATEKMALESTTVDSDSGILKLRFHTDDNKFQALLKSDLFTAVSR